MSVIPTLGRLRQEDHLKFEASLNYTVRLLSPKNKKKNQSKYCQGVWGSAHRGEPS